ncbi:MAG: ClbS/DfsB family four-helix bundle protein [Ktedonobacterales bacterium]
MGSAATGKEGLLAQIRAEHESWRALLDEIGEERMEEPGPMGDWTFKDLVAHLGGWRERTVHRLEAGPGQEPPTPWPSNLTDDDEINAWFYEQNRDRPLRDVLAEYDAHFGRLAAAIAALQDEDITTPGRFEWMEGGALAEADFFDHLHEEHEPSIRAWMAGS